ncbi:MAG: hypothetical protein KDF60_08255 [Calditrichaeota bacterium]|nr:hypothetical protein [Calditrichota bacterium]
MSQFETRGNIELLSQKPIALFASKETPKDLYPDAEIFFEKLCRLPVSLAGGWQAPLEKKLLHKTNTKIKANVIYYSARDIGKIKISEHLSNLNDNDKLLIVSAQSRQTRPSQNDIDKRDKLMFTQVHSVLFLYINEGGRLEKYFNDLLSSQFTVYIFDHPLNQKYKVAGTIPLNTDSLNLII